MKKYFLWSVLILLLAACGSTAAPASAPQSPVASAPQSPVAPAGAVQVDIVYLNHPPLRGVLADLDKLLATYGQRVHVTRYDFDTPQGEAFATSKGLAGHTPLAIFVNGEQQFTVSGHTIRFASFPQGQGTGMVADGEWTMQDLQTVLDGATKGSS